MNLIPFILVLVILVGVSYYAFRLKLSLEKLRFQIKYSEHTEPLQRKPFDLQEEKLRKEMNEQQNKLQQLHEEVQRLNQEKELWEREKKNKDLGNFVFAYLERNEMVSQLIDQLEELKASLDAKGKVKVKQIEQVIHDYLQEAQDFEILKHHVDKAYPLFFEHLQNAFSNLTQAELKHCAYMRMNLQSKEIARLLNIGLKAIQMSRYRIKKKMGLPEEVNLVDYIQKL
jgi:DNA-binding CsgD family transcriptional regulator